MLYNVLTLLTYFSTPAEGRGYLVTPYAWPLEPVAWKPTEGKLSTNDYFCLDSTMDTIVNFCLVGNFTLVGSIQPIVNCAEQCGVETVCGTLCAIKQFQLICLRCIKRFGLSHFSSVSCFSDVPHRSTAKRMNDCSLLPHSPASRQVL